MVNDSIQVDQVVTINDEALANAQGSEFTPEGPFTVLTVKRRSDLVLVQNAAGETHWFQSDLINEIVGEVEPGTAAKRTGRPRKSQVADE